jgi:hypothetical protein
MVACLPDGPVSLVAYLLVGPVCLVGLQPWASPPYSIRWEFCLPFNLLALSCPTVIDVIGQKWK